AGLNVGDWFLDQGQIQGAGLHPLPNWLHFSRFPFSPKTNLTELYFQSGHLDVQAQNLRAKSVSVPLLKLSADIDHLPAESSGKSLSLPGAALWENYRARWKLGAD